MTYSKSQKKLDILKVNSKEIQTLSENKNMKKY